MTKKSKGSSSGGTIEKEASMSMCMHPLAVPEPALTLILNQYIKDCLDRISNPFSREDLQARSAPLLTEVLRYLHLKVLTSSLVGPPSTAVDAMWHAFVLNTEAYAVWCRANAENVRRHT